MNLTTGYPFSLINNGLPATYPKLRTSLQTDVVIIGGGISGALTAYYLTQAGIGCVLADARTIGLGSTCASTSLLQYELDTPLSELAALIGSVPATRAYRLCSEAIDTIGKLSRKLGLEDFEKHPSLYFAARKKHTASLKEEFSARKQAGFEVDFLSEEDIRSAFGFEAPAGILSQQGASTDAYLFTHALLRDAIRQGLQVYDRTRIERIEYHRRGLTLHTENGHRIEASRMVNATGYEITEFVDKQIVTLHSTYAIATEQIEAPSPAWKDKTLLWNTADPYLYLRLTIDNRIIAGGRDEPYYNPRRRDRLIGKKSAQLHRDVATLFPHLEFSTEFSWTGTFGSTKDSLPYIGTWPKNPAHVLCARIRGQRHHLQHHRCRNHPRPAHR